jgi:hypothetical protein
MKDLQSWMESVNTEPDLMDIMITGLISGREGTGNATTCRHLVALQQNDLEWNVAIKGWWSFEWANMQDSFYRSTNSNRTGRRWMISLLKMVWQIAWELWAQRNKVLHQQENEIRDAEEEALNRQICHLYLKAYSALKNTTDGYLMTVPPPALEKKSAIYRKEWVTKSNLALECATRLGRRTHRSLQRMRASMKRWLRRT